MEIRKQELLQWGVAARALEEDDESGDLSLVAPFAEGVLVAVIDGAGHGAQAASPAKRAAKILRRHAKEGPVSLIQRCHNELKSFSRGVVMSLASFSTSENTLTWIGVGNVEGRLIRTGLGANSECEYLRLHGGTLGDRLPTLQADKLPVYPGDMLVFTTDGIRNDDFMRSVTPQETPDAIAQHILEQHSRGDDDALVLVARRMESS